MAIAKTSELLRAAKERGVGVGAFNAANMEMVIGIISAAEAMDTPVILQIAQGRLPYCPLHILGPALMGAARAARVPVAVQLDHGKDLDTLLQALELGFPSVMFDGSDLPFAENIEKTKQAKELAVRFGADLEGEIGAIGGAEDDAAERSATYSDPEQAMVFYQATGVDALSISYGNAHGVYKGTPKLDFERLRTIGRIIPVPLVLHGGSGLSRDDFQRSICEGIVKVNIATASCQAVLRGAERYLAREAPPDYFQLSRAQAQEVRQAVCEYIEIFQSKRSGTDGAHCL